MAKTTVVKLIDDIDGSAAAKTVTFGLDGVTWEIDLSKKNALALEQVLAPYISAGRRSRPGTSHRRVAVSGGRRAAAKVDAATIRTSGKRLRGFRSRPDCGQHRRGL
jgi:hypothetical protein